jgi:AcrR family transcriptional regulator
MQEEQEKRWRRRSDARPSELTAAAFALFAEQGFAATRLEDVATRAGVSKATIYRYFDSKDALFEAVVKSAIAPRFAEAEVLVDAFEGTSPDLLRTFFKVARGALAGPMPALLKMIVSESGTFPQLATLWADLVVSKMMGLVARIIARGIERREFRPVDLAVIGPIIAAPVVLLAVVKQTFSHTQMQFDGDRVLDQHLEILLRGLALDSESSTP